MVLGSVVISIFGWSPFVWSQTEQAGTTEESPARPEIRFAVNWASDAGSYTFVPEKWGELRIKLINEQQDPRDL